MHVTASKPFIVPDFSTPILARRANGHLSASRLQVAHELLEVAIAMQPRHMPAINEMGNCLKNMGRHGEAVEFYQRALAMAPNSGEIFMNLGATYLDLGDLPKAAQHSITAITINPNLDEARWNLAITLLSAGSMHEGWLHARARWRTPRFLRFMPKYKMPFWNGEKDARVFVWGEQGMGERILYAPMVADLARLVIPNGGKVFCDCDVRLLPLLQRSYPEIDFITEGDVLAPGEATHQIGMGDLGGFFRDDMKAFAPPVAYLRPDPRRARAVAAKVRGITKKKVIGLSWRSGNSEYGDHKSMSLFDLQPVMELEDVLCVNLQYGDTAEERAAMAAATGLNIADAGVDLKNDLESLAAIMSACDAVVSVSNSHAHLAGALGVPLLLGLPRFNARFWYWFLDRTDSPWYPKAKLFRQARHGRWDRVVERISAAIKALPRRGSKE